MATSFCVVADVFSHGGFDLNPVDVFARIHQKVVRQVVANRLGDMEALLEGAEDKELLSSCSYGFGGEDRSACNLS